MKFKFFKTEAEKKAQTEFFKAAFDEFGFKPFTNKEFNDFKSKYQNS